MISPDHVLCDIPRISDNFSEPKLKKLENISHLLELKTIYIVFYKILKNTRYTFQNWGNSWSWEQTRKGERWSPSAICEGVHSQSESPPCRRRMVMSKKVRTFWFKVLSANSICFSIFSFPFLRSIFYISPPHPPYSPSDILREIYNKNANLKLICETLG